MPLAANTRDVYDDLAALYLPIAAVVFALVVGALAWMVVRGVRRRGEPSGGASDANKLELAYAGLLAVAVAVLVAATFGAQDREAATAAPAPELVRVVAAKWSWRFEYPRHGIVEAGRGGAPAVLTVPAGEEVRFEGVSLDVIHAFWIPSMRFQRQLIPGRRTGFRLTFPRPGFTSNAACSFFCGLDHASMRFAVRVLPPAEYRAWAQSGGRA